MSTNTTKTLVLSPTFAITINVCNEEFITPLGATPDERQAIGEAYYERSEFWQAMRALPADLSGLDLEPVRELATTRGEETELAQRMKCWRPRFTDLSKPAPVAENGQPYAVSQSILREAKSVKVLRTNAAALEAIYAKALEGLREIGLDFGDLQGYDAKRGTFWLRESEEAIDAILARSGEIAEADNTTLDDSIHQAAREFYQGGQGL